MKPRTSQRKGKAGELEAAALLSRLLGVEVRRGASPYLPGMIAPDVYGVAGLHIECKRVARLNLCAALRQARHDACGAVPVVAHRHNREGWIASLLLEDLPRLATALPHPPATGQEGTPPGALKVLGNRLISLASLCADPEGE